ncbi:MAG: hypothetical protein M1364_02045 [Candidatus Marsarchaeota archaeon]|jgi:hypothetical protein|nr:hypothetical protein [Candidatus Marsarchaeota archaeon]
MLTRKNAKNMKKSASAALFLLFMLFSILHMSYLSHAPIQAGSTPLTYHPAFALPNFARSSVSASYSNYDTGSAMRNLSDVAFLPTCGCGSVVSECGTTECVGSCPSSCPEASTIVICSVGSNGRIQKGGKSFCTSTPPPPPPPSFSVSISPTSDTYSIGQTISIAASVSNGNPPYSYQWYNDTTGTPAAISGQTASTYSATASATGTFSYYVKATDGSGKTAQSSTGQYTVASSISGTLSPSKATLDAGQNAELQASWGGGIPDYEITYYSGTSSSCSSDTNVIASYSGISTTANSIYVSPAASAYYCASVTDSLGQTTDIGPSHITVNPVLSSPSISSSSTAYDDGQTITLAASVSGGTPPYTYEWYNSTSGTDIPIQISSSSTYTETANGKGTFSYYVVVADSASSPVTSTSKPISITVNGLPTPTIAPSGTAISQGSSVTLKASATGGTPPYTYQWYNDTSGSQIPITGAESSEYIFVTSSSTSFGLYYYSVKVTDSASPPLSATSAEASINVLPKAYQSLLGAPETWLSIAFIFTLIVILIAAIVYMLASVISSSNAKNWARIQIYEAVFSVVLFIAFISVIGVFFMNPQAAYSSAGLVPSTCSATDINTLFNMSACDVGTFSNTAFSYFGSLFYLGYVIGFLPGIKVVAHVPGQMGISVSAGIESIFPKSLEAGLSVAFSAILFMLMLNNIQLILISGSFFFLVVFISIGLLIRVLGFTRSFGGILIALGLGLGIVFPLLTSITYGFINVQMQSQGFLSLLSSGNLTTLLMGSITPGAATGEVIYSLLLPMIEGIGYLVAGLTFVPFINFIILDAFIADFSKAIGERINFMSMMGGMI